HWRRDKRLNLPLQEIAHRGCTESGAYVYGVYNVIFFFFFQSFYSNLSLEQVSAHHEGLLPFVRQVGDQDVTGALSHLLRLTSHLMGRTASPDESGYLERLEARGYGNGLCYYHFIDMVALFHAERFDEALLSAERMLPYYFYLQGLYHQPLY